MTKPIGEAGLALIKKWEGCRLTAYVDAVGVLTIGYGHTAGVTTGQTITRAQAEELLRADCQYFADLVDNPAYVPVTSELNANQRDALISFAYNCGGGSLKQLCRDRSVAEIARHITAYNKGVNGVKLAGLVNRRAEELALYNTPVTAETPPEKAAPAPEPAEKRYQTVEEAPAWARETLRRLIAEGCLVGDGRLLDLSEDMLRVLVICARTRD